VVHHQQVDVRLLLQQAQGLVAVTGVQQLVAVGRQHVADVVAGGVGVLGDEDLDRGIAVQPAQQPEGEFVGVLAFLEHVVDHALGQQVVAPALVVGTAENDAGQAIAQHQIDAFTMGRIGQVEVNQGGKEQVGRGFQHQLGFGQGGAKHRLEVALLTKEVRQNLEDHGAVFDDQDGAHR